MSWFRIRKNGILRRFASAVLLLNALTLGATAAYSQSMSAVGFEGAANLSGHSLTNPGNLIDKAVLPGTDVQSSVYENVYLNGFAKTLGASFTVTPAAPIPVFQISQYGQSALNDGRVMVTVGETRADYNLILNPQTNTWESAAPMPVKRYRHQQSTLKDGRVLVTGGFLPLENYSASHKAYLYDPKTNTWSEAANMPEGRAGHSQSVLNDGRVLVAGGESYRYTLDTAYIYDPVFNTWSKIANLPFDLAGAGQSTLPDGRVMVVGGSSLVDREWTSSSKKSLLYNPVTNSWSYAEDFPISDYGIFQSTLLDGRVLINTLKASYLYTPSTNKWTQATILPTGFYPSIQNTLPDGRVLITGRNSSGNAAYFITFNTPPKLSVDNTDQTVWKEDGRGVVTLSGKVSDVNNDPVTISATIAGITKTTTVPNTSSSPSWTLQWDLNTDRLPGGTYTNIAVTASDSAEAVTSTYTGLITVNHAPNVPTNIQPGRFSPSDPQMIATGASVLSWTFNDPDAGDIQTAFQVVILSADGKSQIYDSQWVVSSANTFTVPANLINRGSVAGWYVRVKDSKGAVSNFSPLAYVRINTMPSAELTSYTDGQTLTDNMLTFTWKYKDADQQAQTEYQVVGTNDGWKNWAYNSGEIKSGSTSHVAGPITSGSWNFAVRVKDGTEWSEWSYRNNLMLPNAYEPNDTFEQAFSVKMNESYASAITTATDVDFYKYTAKANGVDRLTLNVPKGLNYNVYIYDSSKRLLAAGIQETDVPENVLYEVTEGQTYYFKIFGVNGSFSESSYSFLLNSLTFRNDTRYEYDNNGNLIKKSSTAQNQ
ncbi:kelch repeat-containing protein [Paenibacillus chitinolyticus]|uniref:Kelch repeat-containing protein n=1 Tax=Paenibacillus chitinolyticus TaxID=79263 RepID=UPI002DBD0F88|nr:kelch repeat-containing protein [Paenibacillus chitinolyticus]MEC0248164.1 kelch repeat-containing protein [Paenibacillus chitinolyticus]